MGLYRGQRTGFVHMLQGHGLVYQYVSVKHCPRSCLLFHARDRYLYSSRSLWVLVHQRSLWPGALAVVRPRHPRLSPPRYRRIDKDSVKVQYGQILALLYRAIAPRLLKKVEALFVPMSGLAKTLARDRATCA